jgi:SAM-dependent methyltransferase
MLEETQLSTLISPDVNLRRVEEHIYSIYPQDERVRSHYDVAIFYDQVMGNRFYNRLVWGYWPTEFATFCQAALTSSTRGWVLDAACGSLVFTAQTYLNYAQRPVVLLDQSIGMLRAAKSRLIKLNGRVPSNMVFLQGDVLQLPFKPHSFATILSMNVLHVLEDAHGLLRELRHALADGCTAFLTSLIANDRLGDIYLRLLHLARGTASPRTVEQVSQIFAEFERPVEQRAVGNMMFITWK